MGMLHFVLLGSFRDHETQLLESYSKQIADNIDNRIEYYVSFLKLLASDRQLPYYLVNESFPFVDAMILNKSTEFLTLNRGRVEGLQLHRSGYYTSLGGYSDISGVFQEFNIDGAAFQSNYYVTSTYLNDRNERVFSIFSMLFQANTERQYLVELRIYESELHTFFSANAKTDYMRISLLNDGLLMSTSRRDDFRRLLYNEKQSGLLGVPYTALPAMAHSISIPLRTQNDMTVVLDTGQGYLDRGYWTLFTRLVPIILLIMIIALGLGRVISIHIQRRLGQLQTQISALGSGDFKHELIIEGQDEFGIFSGKLDDMRLQILHLIQVNDDINVLRRVAEMSALRAQISSHFLFNSLSTIKWLSKRKDFYLLSKAVDSLTVFLRYSLLIKENLVMLAAEIEYLNAYVYLQKLRYDDNAILFQIDVEDELLSCKTVKLILQPLFENAIYHGRKDGGIPLNITLYAEYDDDKYSLIVEDDGNGITKERIRDIYESNNINASERGNGCGLLNVINRVKMCSDGMGSVHIDSKPGAFTKITIRQPKTY
jgi:sensor histidine kinase YesM